MTVMDVDLPQVNAWVEGKVRKLVREVDRPRIEREVVIDIRPDDGIVGIFQANEIGAFANGLLDSPVDLDGHFTRRVIQIQNIRSASRHLPAGEDD